MTDEYRIDGPEDLPLEFHDQQLVIRPGLAFEVWEEVGARLVRMAEGVMWWLGDWWRYGEHRYGDRAFQAVPGGYSVQTLRNAARVAEKFPAPTENAPRGALTRRSDVSWSHHREVASLPDKDAAALLEAAAPPPNDPEGAPRMSTRQLHHEVQRRREQAPPEAEGLTAEDRLATACARAEEDGADWIRVRAADVRALLARAAAAPASR